MHTYSPSLALADQSVGASRLSDDNDGKKDGRKHCAVLT
jgi:hypothetical protein